jgi:hypothetical protein
VHSRKTLLFLTLALAGPTAHAAVLSTTPLPASELGGDRESACLARNPGDQPLEVSVEGFDAQGSRVAALTFDLLPGSVRVVLPAERPGPAARIAVCQFSFPGRKSRLEASIIVREAGSEAALFSRRAR